jgi:hypothetical protein
MNTTQRCLTLLAISLLAILPAGCDKQDMEWNVDPQMGYTGRSPYRTGIRTVAVPIWKRGKEIYRRDLEFRFTESLVKRIELNTPYKVTTKDKADTLLTGTIEKITQTTMSMNPDTGVPREMQVTFTVSYQWEDLRSGRKLVRKKHYNVAAVYLPTPPFNETFFVGSEDLMDRLARRIVETMESDW